MQYTPSPAGQDRMELTNKYRTARMNFLLAIIFTVVNIVLLFTDADIMFLFSAAIPYVAVIFGLASESAAFLVFYIIVAFGIVTFYIVCWVLSGKRYGWLWPAVVLFAIDTVFTIVFYGSALGDVSVLLDIAFHVYVMYYLVMGVKYGGQLKNMPQEEMPAPQPAPAQTVVEGEEAQPQADNATADSPALREADMSVKARVLLAAEVAGLSIIYRRVKRTNELVVNCQVYDQYEALAETAHSLVAVVNGHRVQVGFDGVAHSFIYVDNAEVARKLRLI